MPNNEDEEAQQRVMGLVNQINRALGGQDMAEAQTALTIAVACMIVSTASGRKDRFAQVRSFTGHLEGFLKREDFVEWIKHGVATVVPGPRRNQ